MTRADSAPSADDVTLLRRAAGDHRALEALYRRYVRRVTAFAARRCATADDVADAVAETFDRLLRSAHRYDPERGPVVAFVFAIAGSTIAEQHRQSVRRQALADRLQGRDLLDDDDVARIDTALDAALSVAALAPALDALPAADGEILRLVADGMSPTEAAHELGISANAARTRLSRARRRVRDLAAGATDSSAPTSPPAPTR
jgi:RNA polymerase sigma-70 factor (ECF subfamily)